MKIAFFSETGTNQKYPRNFPNARTEVGWCLALDAPMCHLQQLPNERFDLGIVIVPKTNPDVDLNHIRKVCDKVAIMQEGPHWYFQDYELHNQFHYYNTLLSADIIYCHNYSDIKYYKGLGCKKVRVMRSLMIPEGLESNREIGKGTIIGGNFVSWYGGFDSYMVARKIGNPIVAPSMGRKQELESQIEDIQYLPYMSWRDWISNLGQYNIGIHLMRTHAAGTFAMNCGFHGIPCVGYKGLDTQELLHPNTTIEVGNLNMAKEIAIKLKNDDEFYNECSKESLYRFSEYYTEETWLKNWEAKHK